MKITNIIIVILLLVLCAFAWMAALSPDEEAKTDYTVYITEADAWVKEGLYQRAIENYNYVLANEPSKEVYDKLYTAYSLRYEEAGEQTYEGFKGFLINAVNSYPSDKAFTDSLYEMYVNDGDNVSAYNCLSNAVNNGYPEGDAKERLDSLRYMYELNSTQYYEVLLSDNQNFTARDNTGWFITNGHNSSSFGYEYLGLVSEDGSCVCTSEKDSRLINGEGFVLGIFKEKVTNAGIYSEGLVPAAVDGAYHYFDSFAKKQFGGYEMAGMFENGRAAVKENGKWYIIDNKGKKLTPAYEEIVLAPGGRYINDGMIVVKSGDGKYELLDSSLKSKASFNCEKADIYSADSLIAVKMNGKWGYIDTNGKVVIKAQYDEARSFSNGLGAVCTEGKWGYINTKNELVINNDFLDAGYIGSDGSALVCTGSFTVNDGENVETAEADANTDEEIKDNEAGGEEYFIWQQLTLELGIIK